MLYGVQAIHRWTDIFTVGEEWSPSTAVMVVGKVSNGRR
jgi:hypothetical protein